MSCRYKINGLICVRYVYVLLAQWQNTKMSCHMHALDTEATTHFLSVARYDSLAIGKQPGV